MAKYLCNDGNAEIEIEANSPREAAQEYVDDGSWGEITSTTWINVNVYGEIEEDDDGNEIREEHGRIKIALNPPEPKCADEGAAHDWRAPFSVVGGIKENPGVWGKGGGVTTKEVCALCGTYRNTDTWAHDPQTGEQGLRAVGYEDADEASRAWVEARKAKN